MKYKNLTECVNDLQKNGHLIVVEEEISPYLEIGVIQRRAFKKKSPALLFTNVQGTKFPMLANLFGTRERIEFMFRDSLQSLYALLRMKAEPATIFKKPATVFSALPALISTKPKMRSKGAILECETTISALPQLVSWNGDGGAYITLPQVYTENPEKPGYMFSNLGMYRVQISGNEYIQDSEVGLHYQIHRGIAGHHAQALARGEALAVNIFVGGPPALTIASIMPLPENVPEVCFAGALSGFRIPFVRSMNSLCMPAEADFCIAGYITNAVKPEGAFGDHVGYYSLQHDFPVLHVSKVYHRKGAIYPFTTVGRPPQEDTLFGDFIHDITRDIIPQEFKGITEVHAVDCAGVHPLLLAIAKERYVPYALHRTPEEILMSGFGLLGPSQMSLAKYLFICAYEDSPQLSTKDIPAFFTHILERTHFDRDLHFITKTTIDTLDYTGSDFNRGSKVLWAVAGKPCRKLAIELSADFSLPNGYTAPVLFSCGILLVQGIKNTAQRNMRSVEIEELALHFLHNKRATEGIALCVVVDDVPFTKASWENFLWVTFTRSNPAVDIYGTGERTSNKHWECEAPCIIDARTKPFHAPVLCDDEETELAVERFASRGSVLSKYI